jgi:hypothetical protein
VKEVRLRENKDAPVAMGAAGENRKRNFRFGIIKI